MAALSMDEQDVSDINLLVHIVSHQDIVFDISELSKGRPLAASAAPTYAKPRFHRFNIATKKAYWHMAQSEQESNRESRVRCWSDETQPQMGCWPLGLELHKALDFSKLVAFPWSMTKDVEMSWKDFSSNSPIPASAEAEEAEGSAHDGAADAGGAARAGAAVAVAATSDAPDSRAPLATALLFPLLSTVLPVWRKAGQDRQRHSPRAASKTKQVIVLVSGSGRRRDDGTIQDNSTRYTARLLRAFVSRAYRDIEVWVAHSHHDVYRHDQNVRFLRSVQTTIRAFRQEAVRRHGDAWSTRFHVSSTLGGGTPARVAAATATLRVFSPDLYHLVELKRMWHLNALRFADVDHRSFEAGDAQYEVVAGSLPGPLRRLVTEMRAHCASFAAVRDAGPRDVWSSDVALRGASGSTAAASVSPGHDLESFWMRKSRKPVLAVLLVRWPRQLQEAHSLPEYEVFRGINLEVSLPTGSLCSERAAIAAALASRPFLRREHFVAIAVLSASLTPAHRRPTTMPTLQPRESAEMAAGAPDTEACTRADHRVAASLTEASADGDDASAVSPPSPAPHLPAPIPLAPSWAMLPGASRSTVERGLGLERAGLRPRAIRVGGGLGFVEAPFGCDCHDVFEALEAEGGSEQHEGVTGEAGAASGASGDGMLPGRAVTAGSGASDTVEAAWGAVLPLDAAGRPPAAAPASAFPTASGLSTDGPATPGGVEAWEGGGMHRSDSASSIGLQSPAVAPVAAEERVAAAVKQGLGAGFSGSDVVSNPLPPCGSCAEWLRKVNEVQPDFRVLMFRDTSCERVIVRSVQ